jgi:hypothetical protein
VTVVATAAVGFIGRRGFVVMHFFSNASNVPGFLVVRCRKPLTLAYAFKAFGHVS